MLSLQAGLGQHYAIDNITNIAYMYTNTFMKKNNMIYVICIIVQRFSQSSIIRLSIV